VNHSAKASRWLREPGCEIGAFKTPIPGIAPVYVDKYAEYARERCLGDYFGEAIALPFRDNALNYVASSHVLEHVANPVGALREWKRVLRHGGIIYMVVPDRRYTWDRPRELTPVSHLLDDDLRGTTSVDATHIDEFVDGVDWSTYSPATAAAEVPAEKEKLKQVYHHAVSHASEINIHFHVFEPSNVLELIETLRTHPRYRFDWELVDSAERFPEDNPIGFLAVVRVRKPLGARIAGWRLGRQYAMERNVILAPGARPFPKA
jgi:ubiquinone/menaquinone biosynthesis C-methylase UbiE